MLYIADCILDRMTFYTCANHYTKTGKLGTLPRTRTERTLPFERSDFARFVQQGIKTIGALSETRTRRTRLLRPVPIPIRLPGHMFLVPLLRFELRELLLLREMTLPICPQGHIKIWCNLLESNQLQRLFRPPL